MGNGAGNPKKPAKVFENPRNLNEIDNLRALKSYGLQKLVDFPCNFSANRDETLDFPSPLGKYCVQPQDFVGIAPRKHSSEANYCKFNPFQGNSKKSPLKPLKTKAFSGENSESQLPSLYFPEKKTEFQDFHDNIECFRPPTSANRIISKQKGKRIIVSTPVSLKFSDNSNSKASFPSDLDYSQSFSSKSSFFNETPETHARKPAIASKKLVLLPKSPGKHAKFQENQPNPKETQRISTKINENRGQSLRNSPTKVGISKENGESWENPEELAQRPRVLSHGNLRKLGTPADFQGNDAYLRIYERFKEREIAGNAQKDVKIEVLRDGKTVICKKKDVIVRNNVAIRLVSGEKRGDPPENRQDL